MLVYRKLYCLFDPFIYAYDRFVCVSDIKFRNSEYKNSYEINAKMLVFFQISIVHSTKSTLNFIYIIEKTIRSRKLLCLIKSLGLSHFFYVMDDERNSFLACIIIWRCHSYSIISKMIFLVGLCYQGTLYLIYRITTTTNGCIPYRNIIWIVSEINDQFMQAMEKPKNKELLRTHTLSLTHTHDVLRNLSKM